MKKILFLLILLIPFIVYAEYDESKVTIKSFTKVATTGYGEELSSPTITDDGIKFNIKVSNKDDSVTYELVIKNESGEDIEVYNRIEKDDYIKYTLNTSDLDYVVKNGEEKTFVISALYDNLIEETKLSSGSYNNTHVYSLKVSNELGQEDSVMALADVTHDAVDPDTVDNPKTLVFKDILIIVCIIFVISIGLWLLVRKKNRLGKLFIFIGIIGIVTPIVVYAYKTYNLSLEAKVTIVKPMPLCKRATILHTEVCNSSYGKCKDVEGNGNTITYGNLGTVGTLTAGDAFDCDVNGDGTYDAETERFYYVSRYYDTVNQTFIQDYAALMYYINFKDGKISEGISDDFESTGYPYASSGFNYNGPVDAYTQLPDKTQWKNVSLYTNKRQILSSKLEYANGKKVTYNDVEYSLPVFDYGDRAARLGTIYEINSFCPFKIGRYGDLDNADLSTCDNSNFLLEKSGYTYDNSISGYWLENPSFNTYHNNYYLLYPFNKVTKGDGVYSGHYGVRPFIDVPIDRIEY